MTSQNINMINYISATQSMEAIKSQKLADGKVLYRILTGLLFVFVPMVVSCLFSGMNAQQEYEMQSLRAEVISIAKENAALQVDVAKLEAPARIQRIAETKLGMQVSTGAIYGRAESKVGPQNIRD